MITAGHLATLREFIAACDQSTPPYVITEDVHRSCHTLSGTAKTAGARQGIKIAEPLNRYVRKLYDNSIGMPGAGYKNRRRGASLARHGTGRADFYGGGDFRRRPLGPRETIRNRSLPQSAASAFRRRASRIYTRRSDTMNIKIKYCVV